MAFASCRPIRSVASLVGMATWGGRPCLSSTGAPLITSQNMPGRGPDRFPDYTLTRIVLAAAISDDT